MSTRESAFTIDDVTSRLSSFIDAVTSGVTA